MSFQSTIIALCMIAIILLQPPLYWHTKTRNIPAIILIGWLLIMNIINVVNAAIWSGSDFITAWDGKIWCDITTKLELGASVGIPCAITDIIYNLHVILKATTVLETWNSRRKILKDMLICILSPVIVMAVSYVIQAYRYSIVRYNGCMNTLSSTWLTIILYSLWMFIWALFATLYATLVLIVFYNKRKDVRDILYCTNSGLNLTRFARLLILCFVIILIMLPLSIYGLVQDIQQLNGSYNFAAIHSSALWNVIVKVDMGQPIYTVWIYILASYLVFLIFGLGSDALSMYQNLLRRMHLGWIIDRWDSYCEANRETRLGQLITTLRGSNAEIYGNTSSGDDSESKKDIYNSNSKIYISYDMGEDYSFKKKKKKGYHDIETRYMEHEVSWEGPYKPNLDDECDRRPDFMFGENSELHTEEFGSELNSLNPSEKQFFLRNISQVELADMNSLIENPFKTPETARNEKVHDMESSTSDDD